MSPGSSSAITPRQRFLSSTGRWLGSKLLHHAPLALFLATVLTAVGVLEPAWLRAFDTDMMHATYWLDSHYGGAFREDAVNVQLGSEGAPSITLVSLTPAAWSLYLDRTTPVPRLRLACVLYALGKRLDAISSTRAVVGVDIDVTPIKTVRDNLGLSRVAVGGAPDESNCRAEFAKANGTSSTEAAAMELAIAELAKKRCVIAIALPRFAEEATATRDAFIQGLGVRLAARHPQDPAPCVGFASPNVVQVPHESVYEYPTRRRPFDELPRDVRRAVSEEDYDKQPTEACSLGRSLGARLYEMQDGETHAPCGRRSEAMNPAMLGERNSSAAAFTHRLIDLGPARSTITYANIDVPKQPTGDLLADATLALDDIPPSDIYILTADSGTTEDKFLVPVEDRPVPGAWVHAAVALTEYRELNHKHHSDGEAISYLKHVLYDLALALASALMLDALLAAIRRCRNDVLRDLFLVLAPASVLTAFLGFDAFRVAHHFAGGEWHSPLPVLLGMSLHAYIHLADRDRETEHSAPSRSTADFYRIRQWLDKVDPIRTAAQWIWCFAIALSILLGTHPEDRSDPTISICIAAAAAVVYLIASRQVAQLPLAWRPHGATSHVQHSI